MTSQDKVATPVSTLGGGAVATSVAKLTWPLAASVLGTVRRPTFAGDETAKLEDEEARRRTCAVPGAYPASRDVSLAGQDTMVDVSACSRRDS